MQILNNKDYKLLKSLVKLSPPTLKKTLEEYLKQLNYSVISGEKYIYAAGDVPIALVAHLDTVFTSLPEAIYYDEKQGVLWSPDGLGADDRAGVFAILKILQGGLRPTVIFCDEEEIGGIGAGTLAADYSKPPSELNYIIELDRRGTSDCVFYDCYNVKFIDYVESFGFIENFGSFSDISMICPKWKIAGVNLSIGYEDEHSFIETLHTAPLLSTIQKVKKMLSEENIPKFEYIQDVRYGSPFRLGKNSYFKRDKNRDSYYEETGFLKCDGCGKYFYEYEIFPTLCEDEAERNFCPDCAEHGMIDWCNECGQCYEVVDGADGKCKKCRGIQKIRCGKLKKSKSKSIK